MTALRAFGNGPIYGRRYGDGPPTILALHGWARSAADFDAVLHGLDALAVDLPGFGASPPPPDAIGSADYAGLLGPVLEEFATPPVVLGHSFGGRIGLHLAVTGHASRLVLTGVPLIRLSAPARPPLGFRVARLAHRLSLLSDRRMEQIRRNRGSADYRNATGVMRDVMVKVVNETYDGELERVVDPVHLIWGGLDTEVRPAVAELVAERLEARSVPVTLEVVADAGHMLPVTHPAVLKRALTGEPST